MFHRHLIALAMASLFAASPALAKERDFCADRPGLDTPACTLDPGQAMVEVSLGQWDHTANADGIDDTLTLGDATLRVGLTERLELQLGFTPYVHDRFRDAATGQVTSASSTGDVTIALRRGIAGPNGPIAIEPFVTLPAGKSPGGAGDWGAGVIVPMGFNLPQGFAISLSPEADAAVNSSGSGRHFAFGGVVGLSHALSKSVSLTVEAAALRDLDPSGHETQAKAAASLAWQIGENFQLDLEIDKRLAGGIPDRTLIFGFAKRFR